MSSTTAIRLAVRPSSWRGTGALSSGRPLSQFAPVPRRPINPSICMRQGTLRLSIRDGRLFFSTQPPKDTTENKDNKETESSNVFFMPPPPQAQAEASPSESAKEDTTADATKPETERPTAASESETSKSPESEPTTSASDSAANPSESASETTTENGNNDPTQPELPSRTEAHRARLAARFSTIMDNFQTRLLTATQTLNDLTGYSAIEQIKRQNAELEVAHGQAQSRLRDARHNYKSLTMHRASTQREVTTLLARKDTWNPLDLERFTSLYRLDHELEAQVAQAAQELTEAETEESRLSADLNAGILKRYHEEQIWSDRIRRQSTWGTWGLMGVNVLLFLVLQFVAEPWRRKRLMKGIAENEKGVIDEVRHELGQVRQALEASGLREMAHLTRLMEQEREIQALASTSSSSGSSSTSTTSSGTAAETEEGEMDLAAEFIAAAAEEAAEEAAQHQQQIPETQEEPQPAPLTWKQTAQKWQQTLSDPQQIKAAVVDLYSDRRIDVKMRDVSLLALESAATGAAVVASVAFFVLRSGVGSGKA
ncbi:sensitive to high expression protein 9-like protein, mitochondrial [Neurospora tetraspora]|uniref:Sensitive to high expression protein 9, mitochondrial n=1 Tax=Neurospora tetraspora TaxID=94610 RepID=A0AAE0J9G5_9PEZI|nr:sensitive to high expression protein 9-like protein, mitochondrial [Neurospora tetraspora]